MLKAEELGSALAMPISSFSLAAASPSQSLRIAFEEVSPRMEPFPGVAMEIQQVHPLLHGLRDSLHAETDRDRLILGSFSCKRVKVIAIILSCRESSHLGAGNSDQGPGAAVLGSVPPGRSGAGGCCASGGSSRGCFPCSEMCPCSSSILCHSRAVLHGCWGAPPVSPTTSRQDLSSTWD